MAADVGAVPVQTAIDRIGFGRFQKRLLGVCGVPWAADSAEIFLIAFALPKNRPAAAQYVAAFVEDAKKSGEVQRAIDKAGLAGEVKVAPPE